MILKEIELNMVDHKTCEDKLQGTRLGAKFLLDESFNCAIGKYGIDTCTGNQIFLPPKSSLSVTLIFVYILLCTGDGGGPLLCPGPNALDIRNSFDFGTTKEKKTYYQVS